MDAHCFHQRELLSTPSNIDDEPGGPPQIKKFGRIDYFPVDDDVVNWEDVVCPICLDCPHNSVLLLCASGCCRAFVCDTNHLHSNCLERFKTAYGIPSKSPECLSTSTSDAVDALMEIPSSQVLLSGKPAACPLCRGEVNGWMINEKAREYFNQKKRCCEEEKCVFTGTFSDLQKHAQLEHPDSHPSRIDPVRRLDWEVFQESSDMLDILSSIQSEVPQGVILGDYVIEFGDDNDDDNTRDENEDVSGDDEGNSSWWISCIWHHVFDNLRNRRRRSSRARRGNVLSSFDDGSVTSVEFLEDEEGEDDDDDDDDYVNPIALFSRSNSGH